MIKLFRNIRKKIIAENNSIIRNTNYLKYALGEIVLVVIGILIALQINNWNESRKDRIQVISQLKGIQEDIMLDLNDIDWNTNFHNEAIKSEKQLLDYMMGSDYKLKESIAYEIALGTPIILTLHESSFTNLKNNNLNTITNKKLKKQIANYYDNFSKTILKIENDLVDYQSYSVLKPYFLRHFHYENISAEVENLKKGNEDYYTPTLKRNKLILTDILGLRNDEQFKIVLAETIRFTANKIEFYDNFSKQIKELNEAINKELKTIE